jgi:peroxiredoxin family protein
VRHSVTTPLGIILHSGEFSRAHYALMLASSAAAIGRPVVLFATNAGIRALLRPAPDGTPGWAALDGTAQDWAAHDATLQARFVPGFATLLAAVVEMGARLMVCETGLRAEALDATRLDPALGAEVTGLVAFQEAVGAGAIVFV